MTREGMGSRLCTRTSEANCARATVHVYIDAGEMKERLLIRAIATKYILECVL